MDNVIISFPIFGDGFAFNPSRSFSVFGYSIYWYGVIIACGFLLAVAYAFRRSKQFGVTDNNIIDMLIFAVPSAIICARIYYVIFNPADYFGPGKWINIIKIWNGGLAFYGVAIGAFAAVCIFCKVKKISIGAMLDIGGLGFLIGQSVGRWANLINREAFGGETSLPWKMGLTDALGETIYVHPTFLYESLWNALGFVLLHLYSKKHRKYDGQIFLLYIAWYGFGRYMIEGLRSDSLYLFNTDIRVSQLLALLSFAVAVVFLLRNRLNKKHTPENLFANKVIVAADMASVEKLDEYDIDKILSMGTEDNTKTDDVSDLPQDDGAAPTDNTASTETENNIEEPDNLSS